MQIENIDGSFHIFNQFGTPIVYHSVSLWTAVLPENIYRRIMAGGGDELVDEGVKDYIRSSFLSAPSTGIRAPMGKVPSITLILTHGCNLDCPYCFDRFSDCGQMRYITAVQALRSFGRDHRAFTVVFLGGEPLLEFPLLKRIVEFCEGLCAEGLVEHISYCVTTNGTLVNETMVRFFNLYHFDVTLSVDGVFSNPFNRIIGRGPKVLPWDLIPYYRRLKKLHIRVSVYPDTVNHMRDIYVELQNLRPLSIAFSPIVDDGYIYEKTDEISWKNQLDSIIYYRVVNSFGCRVNTIDTLANSVRQRFPAGRGCSAGVTSFAVDVDGERYPCHRFVGKRNTTPIDAERSEKTRERCNGCWAYNICSGSCAYSKEFAAVSVQNLLCSNRRKEAELACWLALLEQRS